MNQACAKGRLVGKWENGLLEGLVLEELASGGKVG